MSSKFLSHVAAVALVLIASASLSSAQDSCSPIDLRIAPTFDIGANVSRSVMADFNGDGKIDVGVVNFDQRTVSVLNGDGAGGFAPGRAFPTTTNAYSIAAADLNNDSKIDIVAGSGQQNQLAILINTGTGFQAPVMYTAPSNFEFQDLQSGDFNGDGKADIAAIRNQQNRQLDIFLGNGQGSLTFATSLNLTGGESVMEVGNLNGDAFTDIIVSGGSSSTARNISFMYGAAGGNFSLTFGFNVLEKPVGFSIARLNGDPSPDFVVAFEDTTTPTQPFIKPYLSGLGSFVPGTAIEPPYFLAPWDVTTGDYNGDGHQDIAAPLGGHLVMVIYGRGNGEFQDPSHWAMQTNGRSIFSQDLNADGKIDLITTQQVFALNNGMAVLTNLGGGKFNAPKAVLWGLSQISAEDFNNDDLLDFVSSRKSDFVSES
ncbi:MAG TPA: VCBS repeat-containing protein, partial [Pyrinomonadaceae bacterium]|nr:VCBS repeat-containing protein [Pyrinomonadaceae bacterium]